MCNKYQFKLNASATILLKLFVIVFEPRSPRGFAALAVIARNFVKILSLNAYVKMTL
jgi:hypothetical protein